MAPPARCANQLVAPAAELAISYPPMVRWLVVGGFVAALSAAACDAPIRDGSPVPAAKLDPLSVGAVPTNNTAVASNTVVNTGVVNPSGGGTLEVANLGVANTTVANTTVGNLSVANTTTQPQCSVDGDCSGKVTLASACQKASCSSGTCVVAASGVTSCDDGNACTYNDTCSGTTCAGTAITCTDSTSDPCHHLACNGTSTCLKTALSTGSCDDKNPCTKNDTCSNGSCVGTAYSCATDACATETCDGKGGCSSTPLDAAVCKEAKDGGHVDSGPAHEDAARPVTDAAEPHDAHVARDAHGAADSASTTGGEDAGSPADKVGGCACDLGARAPGYGLAGGLSLVLAALLGLRRRRARS